MFYPEGQVRVFLYGEPVSMRLSFDGLQIIGVAVGTTVTRGPYRAPPE